VYVCLIIDKHSEEMIDNKKQSSGIRAHQSLSKQDYEA
jgi:hypothetical protein